MCGSASLMLSALSTAVTAAGTYMTYQAQQDEANALDSQASANAAAYAEEADAVATEYEASKALRERQLKQLLAEQKAAYAAAGVSVDSGSPLDASADSTSEFNLEEAAFKTEAENEIQRLLTAGGLSYQKTKDEASAANTSSYVSLFSGTSKILSSNSLGTLFG